MPHPCDPEAPHCGFYWPGHNMHFIHGRHLQERPWGWRDALVERIAADGWLDVRYLHQDAPVRVWHHRALNGLRVGWPVRVHEEYHALATAAWTVNVAVHDGLGPVPAPEAPELWQPETGVAVVDHSTGRMLPPIADAGP